MKKLLSAFVALVTLAPAVTHAATLTFTDRAAWEAAMAGTITTVDFEGIVPSGDDTYGFVPVMNVDGVVFTDTEIFIAAASLWFDAAYHTSDYLDWQSASTGSGVMTVQLPSASTGVGFDFGEFGGAPFTLHVQVGSEAFDLFNDSGEYNFFGLIADTPFSLMTLSTSPIADPFTFATLDNLSYGVEAEAAAPVPEPATLLLLGSGLIAAARARSKRA